MKGKIISDKYEGQKYLIELEGEISLRDYFAGQALSIFNFGSYPAALNENEIILNHQKVADFCYNLADAMLEKREKK